MGFRIVKVLLALGAEVRTIVRPDTPAEKTILLEEAGVKIFRIDSWTLGSLIPVCSGASCVVSAVAGLREVVIGAQKVLLDAAIAAKVPRFIPSDYSLDFTKFSEGKNRNLDSYIS